ncbi:MAG: nitrate reductase cytochrome c-type subunit [Gammaproteobacteria bacterium]|nr:nitrate reductase cytochrome c-type subunit [Gammaproteobacteria bacterium]
MKIKFLLVSTLLAAIGIAGCQTMGGGPKDQASMGIGQDAIFNEALPSSFDYPDTKAGQSDLIAKSYHTAPPMVPHVIEKYLPITAEDNQCMDCHDYYDKIGTKHVKGKRKYPMPKSHYGGFAGKGVRDEASGARYTCTQCHAAVSNAQPLVENTF